MILSDKESLPFYFWNSYTVILSRSLNENNRPTLLSSEIRWFGLVWFKYGSFEFDMDIHGILFKKLRIFDFLYMIFLFFAV